jgi:hypothetical protein
MEGEEERREIKNEMEDAVLFLFTIDHSPFTK